MNFLKLNVNLFFIGFLFSCSSTKECIKLDQSYVNGSDHGYVNFYICSEKCEFFVKYEKLKNIKMSEDSLKLYNKVQEFKQSAKIISPHYYKELKKYIKPIIYNGVDKEGVLYVEFFDTNEKFILGGTIKKKDYLNFKDKVYYLNKKYKVSIENQDKIDLYFDIIEKGTDQ